MGQYVHKLHILMLEGRRQIVPPPQFIGYSDEPDKIGKNIGII